jgi:hypothetical protein
VFTGNYNVFLIGGDEVIAGFVLLNEVIWYIRLLICSE